MHFVPSFTRGPSTTSVCMHKAHNLLMSSRVTRSSARQAAASQGGSSGQSPVAASAAPAGALPTALAPASTAPANPSNPPPPPPPPASSSRKRKAPPTSPEAAPPSATPNIPRRTKRQKVAEPALQSNPQSLLAPPLPPTHRTRKKGRASATMSSPEYVTVLSVFRCGAVARRPARSSPRIVLGTPSWAIHANWLSHL